MAKIVIKDGELSSSAGINIPGSLAISGNVTIGDNFTDTLTVFSTATFNDDLTVLDTISGSIGRFNNISSNIVSASTYQGRFLAAGSNQQIQFNSGSVFSGSSNLIFNYTTNTLSASNSQFGNITRINNVITSFPASQGSALTRLRNDGAGNLTWSTNSTFTTNTLVSPTVFDASLHERVTWIAAFTGNVVAQISNLTTGREIYLYIQNTFPGSSRTLTIQASSTNLYTNVGCSRSGSPAVSTITLSAGSGAATVWVANIGGNIVGAIY